MKSLFTFTSVLTLVVLSGWFSPVLAGDGPGIEEQLQQDWVLESGWLTDDEMIFFNANVQLNSYDVHQVFTFADNDVMAYNTIYPNNMGVCGTGMLSVDEAYWSTNGEMVTLVVKGGHLGVDNFEYIIQYAIEELTDEYLKLTKYRTVMSKEQSFLSL